MESVLFPIDADLGQIDQLISIAWDVINLGVG